MLGKNVSVVYFYLVSLIGLILMIFGVFFAINYFVNITQYDTYPLRYSESCDTIYAAPVDMQKPSDVDIEKQKRDCEVRQSIERKRTQVDDLKNAISFPLIGIILFLIHFPIARRQTK
ncbi:MAG: hypothetical protein ABIO02_04030 [Patescibacteria group bacterium]